MVRATKPSLWLLAAALWLLPTAAIAQTSVCIDIPQIPYDYLVQRLDARTPATPDDGSTVLRQILRGYTRSLYQSLKLQDSDATTSSNVNNDFPSNVKP